MKPIHKKAVIISLLFGVLSTAVLIYLKPQGVFLILILWILVPVLIKKGYDKVSSFGGGR